MADSRDLRPVCYTERQAEFRCLDAGRDRRLSWLPKHSTSFMWNVNTNQQLELLHG